MKRLEISQEKVLELFYYKDGNLYHRNNDKPAGSVAKNHRYARVVIKQKSHKLHRLIFLYHHGYLPDIVDHINGNRYDNRIENLREANTYQNRQNSRIYSTSKSGVKNVYWAENCQKWRVSFSINGKRKTFGSYVDLEEAKQVATSMRDKYFKEFANHGSY